MDDSETVDDTCDHCQGEATIFCNQCKSSYCSTCSSVRHRAEKRKEHFVVRISQLYTDTHVLSVDPPKKTIPNEGKLLIQALRCRSGKYMSQLPNLQNVCTYTHYLRKKRRISYRCH